MFIRILIKFYKYSCRNHTTKSNGDDIKGDWKTFTLKYQIVELLFLMKLC